jgi:predicted sulfurtransferase
MPAMQNRHLYCGVVESRGLEDVLGTTCGRTAETLCYDCGTSLCPAHNERCEICHQAFCSSCLTFHRSDHPKPMHREQQGARAKKSA